ncbi:phosphodiesterase [Salinarimonas ramus]|uniref:3',5'-cyclic adenosine monophosphate phosphodiesterase CpdA n=1 Tax=Salinarimonas ramus TaxID=690164 RepID=A0A917QIN6_9HYPH|nr:phosphodiesterase [Salinarimonas ramus]GGK51646.1 3',5'-cyclic adenosine monophosphate phosphodiesterase CpdA [Salinarimonas ramus]
MTLLAQLSDLHIREGGALAYGLVDTRAFLARAVDHLNALLPRPDAVVVSGDLVDLGTASEYAMARAELDRLAMPWLPIPGNHDGDAFWDACADRMAAPVRGVGWVARVADTRIVLLDTRVPDALGGAIDETRARWLSERLSESDAPALLVMHHPPIPTGIGHMDAIGLDGVDRLEAALAAGPAPMAILCGHIHRMIVGRLGATPVIVAPSPAHAVTLDLAPDAPSTFHLEPPGVLLHAVSGGRLVTHLSFVGAFDGPHPFFAEGTRLVGT